MHTRKTEAEAEQQRQDDLRGTRTKMNKVKIDELLSILNQAVDSFNRAAPENQIFLSKGSSDDYTLTLDKADLQSFRIYPYFESMKLRGLPVSALVEVNFRTQARPDEGLAFVLCLDESNPGDYGQWKVLEATNSPLVRSPGVYPLAVDMALLQTLVRQGNAMSIHQYELKNSVTEELEAILGRSIEYRNQVLEEERRLPERKQQLIDELEDYDDAGFGY